MNEPRVGYASLDALCDLMEDYIKAYTVDGKYTGDVHYLIQYDKFKRYLEK